jgi:hypothetical protein
MLNLIRWDVAYVYLAIVFFVKNIKLTRKK